MRPFVSSVLAAFIFLTQVGLPIHMHYCKGMLESVSVLVKSACSDHEEIAASASCCQKEAHAACTKEGNGCCDDETTVISQELTSLAPKFQTDLHPALPVALPQLPGFTEAGIAVTPPTAEPHSGQGPPIYLLHQALIFYA